MEGRKGRIFAQPVLQARLCHMVERVQFELFDSTSAHPQRASVSSDRRITSTAEFVDHGSPIPRQAALRVSQHREMADMAISRVR